MNLPNMFLYLLLVSSCFSQYTFSLYSSAKDSIKLPSYTPNQRQLVADQVKNMMSVYVNRESKIKNYNVDPVPEANRIAKLASLMSDEEFQRSTSNMFLSLRDFHTNYCIFN